MDKKKLKLSQLIFMALCCDMGIFLKKLIAPATNVITEFLHIPGGIGTSFSLMFVLIAAFLYQVPGCATLMCVVQSLIALAMGTTGSMGVLAPIGYIVPGIVMDLCILIIKVIKLKGKEWVAVTNAFASVAAALCANIIVFRLWGVTLILYVAVAFTSGILSGALGAYLIKRIRLIYENGKNEN